MVSTREVVSTDVVLTSFVVVLDGVTLVVESSVIRVVIGVTISVGVLGVADVDMLVRWLVTTVVGSSVLSVEITLVLTVVNSSLVVEVGVVDSIVVVEISSIVVGCSELIGVVVITVTAVCCVDISAKRRKPKTTIFMQ